MYRTLTGLGGLLFCMFALLSPAGAGQPGTTETVFNRRFIPQLRPEMTYAQVEKLAGGPGLKTGEDKNSVPATVQYRWTGGRNSVLTVKIGNNKLVEATVLAPNGHTYVVQGNGKVVER